MSEDVKASGFTLKLANGEDSEVGVGMCVWSTGGTNAELGCFASLTL